MKKIDFIFQDADERNHNKIIRQMLTSDQEEALNDILNFLQSSIKEFKDCSTLIYGPAGSGKSFLTRFIADKIRGKYNVAGVAPTHKARKVLDRFLNRKAFYQIKTITVASLLSKIRSHHYLGVMPVLELRLIYMIFL